MLETIEMRKQHEIKIHKYKNIQKYYNSFLFAISIIYFLYFIIIDHFFQHIHYYLSLSVLLFGV